MQHVQRLVEHFSPTWLQLAYSGIIATLLSLYWCRNDLLYVLTFNTQTSGRDLHASFGQALGQATNNGVASFLSLAIFWGLVGLALAAVIYESANMLIGAWNDYVIATTYTRGKDYKRNLLKVLLYKFLIILGFTVFIILSWLIFFKLWNQLITQPVHLFLQPVNIAKELLGLSGLTANIYLGWMGLLYLVPQFMAI